MSDAMLAVHADVDAAVDRQWAALGGPGTWMSGSERLDVLGVARDGMRAGVATPALDAASAVAHAAAKITAAFVDDLETRGLTREHYVEIVGIVSRAAAIDTFERGLGRERRSLPTQSDGEPSRRDLPGARRRAGWVPTVHGIAPPTALEAVEAEASAQRELHGALYLTYEAMGDLAAVRDLTRAQMELVAARVSYLNDCSY